MMNDSKAIEDLLSYYDDLINETVLRYKPDHLRKKAGRKQLFGDRILSKNEILNHISKCEKLRHDKAKAARIYIDGGSDSYRNFNAKTTVCYAAFDARENLIVSVGISPANNPTPGRVWKCLQPFGSGKDETVLRKSLQWAKSYKDDRFAVNTSPSLLFSMVKSYDIKY